MCDIRVHVRQTSLSRFFSSVRAGYAIYDKHGGYTPVQVAHLQSSIIFVNSVVFVLGEFWTSKQTSVLELKRHGPHSISRKPNLIGLKHIT